jgi:hypothetical protein
LEIFVADVQGLPMPNQRVSIVGAQSGTDFGGDADANARIRMPVPPGRYEVRVATEHGWEGVRKSVAVNGNCTVVVEITLGLAPIAVATPQLCFQALDRYCGNGSCSGYSASAAETRRIAASDSCAIAAFGTCGGLRFTRVGDGFVSATEYFDAEGKLVAARTTTDVHTNLSCPGWTHYGPRLTCREITTIDYCER